MGAALRQRLKAEQAGREQRDRGITLRPRTDAGGSQPGIGDRLAQVYEVGFRHAAVSRVLARRVLRRHASTVLAAFGERAVAETRAR
jgi:hypothetical protein